MKEYIVRFLIAGFMMLCISLLFLGGMQARAESGANWEVPAEGIVSDVFGTRNGTHKGIDIAGMPGSPVKAVKEGIVRKSYQSATYGNVILIRHPDGYETVYAHLAKRLVSTGQDVGKGQPVGTMGTTGESTGVHLHFEIHAGRWNAAKDNALNPSVLIGAMEVGQELAFNGNEKASILVMEYKVIPGDSLWGIAKKHGIPVSRLQQLNDLDGSIIQPGQTLKIRHEFVRADLKLADEGPGRGQIKENIGEY